MGPRYRKPLRAGSGYSVKNLVRSVEMSSCLHAVPLKAGRQNAEGASVSKMFL